MLLAQCFDPADCDIPRALPWWMAAAFVAVWLALVVGIFSLVRHLLRSQIERRRTRRRPAGGTDVELYRGTSSRAEVVSPRRPGARGGGG